MRSLNLDINYTPAAPINIPVALLLKQAAEKVERERSHIHAIYDDFIKPDTMYRLVAR